MTFRETLGRWVERSGLSNAEIDRAIGKGRGYVGRVMKGTIPPPDRATCDAIGEVLAERQAIARAAEVWDLAARERLEALDPDLRAWLDETRPISSFSRHEQRALESLEKLRDRLHTTDPLGFLRLLVDGVLEPGIDAHAGAADFSELLHELAYLDTPELHATIRRWFEELLGARVVKRIREQRIGTGILMDHILAEK